MKTLSYNNKVVIHRCSGRYLGVDTAFDIFAAYPDHHPLSDQCWVRLPSGCNNVQIVLRDYLPGVSSGLGLRPTPWFVDAHNSFIKMCNWHRLGHFNSICDRTDADNYWGPAAPMTQPYASPAFVDIDGDGDLE